MPTNKLNTVRESFFNTVFSLLGHIANCDGFINRNEIKRIELYMEKMDLTEHCKREAKHLFRAGTSPQFDINQVLKDFSKTATPNLVQILLVYLISMARTDGRLVDKEMSIVQQVATELGYKSIVFNHLLRMISAQDELASVQQTNNSTPQQSHEYAAKNQYQQQKNTHQTEYTQRAEPKKEGAQESGSQKNQYQHERPGAEQSGKEQSSKEQSSKEQSSKEQSSKDQSNNESGKQNYYSQAAPQQNLHDAYEALGVTAAMSEKEIKKAYQKLVSQFHPDKLIGQGMPPDLLNAATERFRKIKIAYEYIKKSRHINVTA